jgi:hypothetical protein
VLKPDGLPADIRLMRYQRLILESGSIAFTLPLHPRLTVIAGVGVHEREGLVGEILGSMSGSRRHTRLEVMDDSGRRLSISRGVTPDEDRVIELETGRDVSVEFTRAGRVDVLASMGLDLERARRRTRLSATDVAAASRSDALIATLAALDQDQLWKNAERVLASDTRLKMEAEAAGASEEDLPVIEEVEERHAAFEAAQRRLDWIRHHGIFIGGAGAIGAIPAGLMNRWTALPFLGVAAANTAISIVFRRHMEKARRLEGEALDKAGAESYLGFHMQRMNQLLESQQNRQRIAEAAAERRKALDAWRVLVGEVSPEWAMTVRERILAASQRVDLVSGNEGPSGSLSLSSVEPAELAQALIVRLADLRHAGAGGESLPLILDEPLVGVEPSVKQWMLELVGRSAGMPQVVYLTNDPDVANWARMEAIAGHLDIVEPAADPVGSH